MKVLFIVSLIFMLLCLLLRNFWLMVLFGILMVLSVIGEAIREGKDNGRLHHNKAVCGYARHPA